MSGLDQIVTGIVQLLTVQHSGILIAAAAFLLGALVRLINFFVNRRKTVKKDILTEHLALRKELREELDAVKRELHAIQTELDEWKEKYFHQVELTNKLNVDILNLTVELSEYKECNGCVLRSKEQQLPQLPILSEDSV